MEGAGGATERVAFTAKESESVLRYRVRQIVLTKRILIVIVQVPDRTQYPSLLLDHGSSIRQSNGN